MNVLCIETKVQDYNGLGILDRYKRYRYNEVI